MDAIVTLLTRLGWAAAGRLEGGKGSYDKPVFQHRDWKALVGHNWVTIWRLAGEVNIAEMESFRTDDLELVECAARGAMDGTFADLLGPRKRAA